MCTGDWYVHEHVNVKDKLDQHEQLQLCKNLRVFEWTSVNLQLHAFVLGHSRSGFIPRGNVGLPHDI